MKHPGALAVMAGLAFLAMGQDPKKETGDQPRVLVCLPLGVPAGPTSRVTLRGLKLEGATGVRVAEAGVGVKLLTRGKAGVPAQQEPARVGDTQVEVEVTVPANFKGTAVTLRVTTPGGSSQGHQLLVTATPPLTEKEPNNGFRTAQAVQLPANLDGLIAQPHDVDVFRFEGKQGQQVVVEVLADRLGSALDAHLTLYDSEGQIVASNDDTAGSRDARIEAKLPRDGTYLVSLIDAQDQGGPAHGYRLMLTARLR